MGTGQAGPNQPQLDVGSTRAKMFLSCLFNPKGLVWDLQVFGNMVKVISMRKS